LKIVNNPQQTNGEDSDSLKPQAAHIFMETDTSSYFSSTLIRSRLQDGSRSRTIHYRITPKHTELAGVSHPCRRLHICP
jgi:hypothetical protein